MISSLVSLVLAEPEGRVLAHEAVEGLAELVGVGPLGRGDRKVDDRLGGVDALERVIDGLVAIGVAGGRLDPHDGDDVAGAGGVDVFLLVGVDPEDSADPALLALAGVVIKLALADRPLIDPHISDLAERLLDELEGHRHHRRVGGRRPAGLRPIPLALSLAMIWRSRGLGR